MTEKDKIKLRLEQLSSKIKLGLQGRMKGDILSASFRIVDSALVEVLKELEEK